LKYRKDFVTNSSSSSFVCDICGCSESGYDMSMSEAGMYECVNGHTICESEILLEVDYKEVIQSLLREGETFDFDNISNDELEDIAMNEFEYRYNVPEKYCPICMMIQYSEYDMARYLQIISNITKESVFQEVKKLNKRRKKLYDSEYIEYVCKQVNTSTENLIQEIRQRFASYMDFKQFLRKGC
jgi:hypothetical protein